VFYSSYLIYLFSGAAAVFRAEMTAAGGVSGVIRV
jgi:hypothetical protein